MLLNELVTLVAASVLTTGGPVALSVVKVLSAPKLVPSKLVAIIGNDKRGLPLSR